MSARGGFAFVVQPFTGDWESEEQRELYRRYLDVCRLERVSFVGLPAESAGLASAWGLEGGGIGFESGYARGAYRGSKRNSFTGRRSLAGGRGARSGGSGGRGICVESWRGAGVLGGADGGSIRIDVAELVGEPGSDKGSDVAGEGGRDHGDGGGGAKATATSVLCGGEACAGVRVVDAAGSGQVVAEGSEAGLCAALGRGPNWERNRASREKKKRQKQMRSAQRASLSGGAGCSGLESNGHCASGFGAGSKLKASVVPDLVRDNQEGFWNSCSKDVRQELVDSKARMHIAENERRAREAKEKVAYLDSPEAMLRKAMSMVGMAEKCAKQKNDSKVAGWAETVATSYAESIAKSAPSSVPSYASVLSGLSATSVSVDGTKRKKPQALGLPRKSYGGDPQNPSYTYYEKRIGSTNNPIGLEKILDELQENMALADIDRTVLLSKCYDKKQRHGGVEVFA